jgi:PAS domain S-box-containing protein
MRNLQQDKRHVRELGERIMDAAHRLHDLAGGDHAEGALREGLSDALEELRSAEASLVEEGERLGADSARYHAVFEAGRDPCVLTNIRGRVVDANEAADVLFGRDPTQPPAANIVEIFDRDSRAGAASMLERARQDGAADADDLRLRSAHGQSRRIAVTAHLLAHGSDGPVVRWLVRDATPLSGGAAREATAVRDEFLGLMSHELKTPIAVIAGNADVLARRNGQLGQGERAEALADIRSEAERLRRLVDNMLVLARLERKDEIGRAPVDVGAIVGQRVDQHHREWPERPFELEMAGVPPVDVPEEYLAQALRNLLTNAEQNSPPGSPIEIRAWVEGEGVLVSVLDRGGGVDSGELKRIFSPFYRFDAGTRRQGAGIGLAATRRLIEAQGGHVRCERREGGGMAFSLWLPAYQAETPDGQVRSNGF